MSHDTEAAYASSEVADMIMLNQDAFFGTMGTSGLWSVYAMREGGHQWPLADGVILAENTTHSDIKIAFEYKRPNEGVLVNEKECIYVRQKQVPENGRDTYGGFCCIADADFENANGLCFCIDADHPNVFLGKTVCLPEHTHHRTDVLWV